MLEFLKIVFGSAKTKTALDNETAKTVAVIGRGVRSLGLCLVILCLSAAFVYLGYMQQLNIDARCEGELKALQYKYDKAIFRHDSIINDIWTKTRIVNKI